MQIRAMTWSDAFVIYLTLLTATTAINRPVYKVVLTQKGFIQFLQYDLETPPLKEFTFCTWIRVYDLSNDQSIFTYVGNGNSHVLRLWLDSGGRSMKVSLNGKVASSTPVDIAKDVWRHICLSYQSDYGAWALYIDAKLVSCEVAQSLYGFELPKGGYIIIGYGRVNNGISSGLEGEIFGANMILSSTIERNHTTKLNHLYDQKAFRQNKIKGNENNNNKYIILNDLQTDEIHNNFEKTPVPLNKTKSYIRVNTPHINIEHDVGLDVEPRKPKISDVTKEKEILDFPFTDTIRTTSEKNVMNLWNLVNKAGHEGKFKMQKKIKPIGEISGSSTKELATISEYETPPPPPGPPSSNYFNLDPDMNIQKPTSTTSMFNIPLGRNSNSMQHKNKLIDVLPDVETPPPPAKDTKVYGQWTSSKFAGNVLNYLKHINYYNKEKKTPSTIPLTKVSDNYPYASEFRITKLRPPVQFQRRNFIDRQYKRKIQKRGVSDQPQINVKIVEEDLRSVVLKQHAQTYPKDVVVTNRGEPVKKTGRFYRNTNDQKSSENSESMEEVYKSKPSKNANTKTKSKILSDYDLYRNDHLMTILPFLKSLEYFVEDSQNTKSDNVVRSSGSDKYNKLSWYSKSLSNANKWHNVKSYNNDYTPRRINVDSNEGKSDIDFKIAEANKKNPTIRLKYKHENNKLVENNDDPTILKGRELAMSVSNQSNANTNSISIVKYNHGFLPSHDKKLKESEKTGTLIKSNLKQRMWVKGQNNFNKNVKLGNALNEKHVIGVNEQQKKQSFVGGDEKIPDINRYRSDLDNENTQIPPSLGLRVCKTKTVDDRALYVQNDQSIDTSHILSPVKSNNLGIEFIQLNYNKCSLVGSFFERNYLLFIDWGKTPVRLFGGAYPKTTTDLCGFFK